MQEQYKTIQEYRQFRYQMVTPLNSKRSLCLFIQDVKESIYKKVGYSI